MNRLLMLFTIFVGGLEARPNLIDKEDSTMSQDAWCPWQNANCIRKCCPIDEEMVTRNVCEKSNSTALPKFEFFKDMQRSEKITLEDFIVLYNHECDEEHVKVIEPQENFFLQENGSLLLLEMDNFIPPTHYCIDVFDGETKAFICMIPDDPGSIQIIHDTVILSVVKVCGGTDLIFLNDSSRCYGNLQTCIRKCCPENHVKQFKKCLSVDGSRVFSFPVYDGLDEITNDSGVFHLIANNSSCGSDDKIVRWDPNRDIDKFYVQRNGSLFRPYTGQLLSFDRYCLDDFLRNNVTRFSALVCLNKKHFVSSLKDHEQFIAGMIISMPFLVATLLVYAVLPDRNLHQKALMCYVFFLLFAYVFLVTIQLSNTQFDYITCNFLGFSTLFCFMVSFFWMNVICLDIWFTFSGSRGLGGNKRQNERRRFLYYCAYALGLPSLHIIIAVLINELGDQEQWYHPNVGRSMCFLESGVANLIYMYGPIAILLTINVILFTLTAFKIRQVKKETSMLKHSDSKRHNLEKDKQKFNLYLKLLLAMGVNWSMEVVSWAVEWRMQSVPRYVWYLTDLCNALYGVFIFVIFVFKKKIWRLLQNRYYSFMGKPHLGHSMTTTRSTRTSNYSSGVYSTTDTAFSSASRTHATATRPEEVALNRM